jgi:hypothetical protein
MSGSLSTLGFSYQGISVSEKDVFPVMPGGAVRRMNAGSRNRSTA